MKKKLAAPKIRKTERPTKIKLNWAAYKIQIKTEPPQRLQKPERPTKLGKKLISLLLISKQLSGLQNWENKNVKNWAAYKNAKYLSPTKMQRNELIKIEKTEGHTKMQKTVRPAKNLATIKNGKNWAACKM
jgi:hypothetical protein